MNEATDEAQMLLLDYDHRVAVRLYHRINARGYRMYDVGFAYYPTPGALPVPNVPILVSQPDRKAALRANKRLKVLQGVANFRAKASSEPTYYYSETRIAAWMQICQGDKDLHTALARADMNDVRTILRIDPKELNKACRIVTEHTYLKF